MADGRMLGHVDQNTVLGPRGATDAFFPPVHYLCAKSETPAEQAINAGTKNGSAFSSMEFFAIVTLGDIDGTLLVVLHCNVSYCSPWRSVPRACSRRSRRVYFLCFRCSPTVWMQLQLMKLNGC